MGANACSELNPSTLREAAQWFARINDEAVDSATTAEWQRWLESSAENRRAWSKVEAIDNQIRAVNTPPARSALNAPAISRRRMLKTLAVFAIGTPLTARLGWQLSEPLRADFSTGTGEIKQHRLADGTDLWLNTDSAVKLRFTPESRRIELLSGEIAIQTGKDSRPLTVKTAHGVLQPLGTRFNVHQQRGGVELQVYQGRVAIKPAESEEVRIITAGNKARFNRQEVSHSSVADQTRAKWTQGILVTDGLTLKQVVDQLARYRHGYLGIDDEVADLRLVGAFPLQESDSVLAALEQSLPIKVVRLTPWWVKIQPLQK